MTQVLSSHSPTALRGAVLLATSLSCYVLGVSGLLALILAMGGLIPLGWMTPLSPAPAIACVSNLLLLSLFGVQHSIMARRSFKAWLVQYLPASLERSLFVAASGMVLLLMVALWQPVGGHYWHAEGNARLLLWGGFGVGWLYMLAATFAINHFDLFGLRQAWLDARGEEYTPVAFVENWMYRFSRHPLMLGVLVGLWSLPQMNGDTLFMAIGMSAYMAIGLYFEERDLIQQWGDTYRAYKQRVGALITFR